MRAVACLPTVLLAGCSALLGLEDPIPRTADGGVDARTDDGAVDARTDAAGDAAIDAPSSVGGRLLFSLASVSVARHQTARFHVLHMHDTTMDDVTNRVTLVSSDDAIATSGAPGQVSGASQAGSATITATWIDAAAATLDVTVKAAECHPVINEFTTGSGTGPTAAANEFIELYNPCTGPIDVTNWTLVYRGGNTVAAGPDDNVMVTLAGEMAPKDLRVYGGADFPGAVSGRWLNASGVMQQAVGAVGLRSADTGTPLIDSVAYGAVAAGHPFAENQDPAGTMANGLSASRLPFDGKDDDDNNADVMIITTPTPGALNTP